MTRPRYHQGGGLPNILPSSTNPTRPYTINTVDEYLDMQWSVITCRQISLRCCLRGQPHPKETIAAEDILHDKGAFSMIASDSQATGRRGEVITRTATAHKMKDQFDRWSRTRIGMITSGQTVHRKIHHQSSYCTWDSA